MRNKVVKNGDGKMNPAITREQEKIDSQTENPIDTSKAAPDADHNENPQK